MTEKELNQKCKAVAIALSDLTLTEKLKVVERCGKRWRQKNSISINEEVASTRVKMTGKRIKDVDVIKPE